MMSKNYHDWMKYKEIVENKQARPIFREREIWWCSLGLNVGYETDGKNEFFTRPVLIIKKFNQFSFYGVPLTSQEKVTRYYVPLEFHHKTSYVMISQMKLLDSKRLRSRMGEVPLESFLLISETIKKLLP